MNFGSEIDREQDQFTNELLVEYISSISRQLNSPILINYFNRTQELMFFKKSVKNLIFEEGLVYDLGNSDKMKLVRQLGSFSRQINKFLEHCVSIFSTFRALLLTSVVLG